MVDCQVLNTDSVTLDLLVVDCQVVNIDSVTLDLLVVTSRWRSVTPTEPSEVLLRSWAHATTIYTDSHILPLKCYCGLGPSLATRGRLSHVGFLLDQAAIRGYRSEVISGDLWRVILSNACLEVSWLRREVDQLRRRSVVMSTEIGRLEKLSPLIKPLQINYYLQSLSKCHCVSLAGRTLIASDESPACETLRSYAY